jgi:hypothetical protein
MWIKQIINHVILFYVSVTERCYVGFVELIPGDIYKSEGVSSHDLTMTNLKPNEFILK